jgi:predicted transcriptional regulator
MNKDKVPTVAVTTRVSKEVAARLPESGVRGLRAAWIREAIEEKLKREKS